MNEINCCKKHRIAFSKDKCDICDLLSGVPAATQEPAESGASLQATKDETRGDVCEGNAPRLLAESPSNFGSPRKVGEDGAYADDSYKCENGHTFNAQAHSPHDLPPEHCPECGNKKVALEECKETLDSIWAAIGDALCSGRGIEPAYANTVASQARAASDKARAALAPSRQGAAKRVEG